MNEPVKLGATYRHYKTQGLYTALQLVRFEDEWAGAFRIVCAIVTFTGDGPNENHKARLVTDVLTGKFSLAAHYRYDVALQLKTEMVLYHSKQHCEFFVRPLTEFIAQVEVPQSPTMAEGSMIRVPRFALVEGT